MTFLSYHCSDCGDSLYSRYTGDGKEVEIQPCKVCIEDAKQEGFNASEDGGLSGELLETVQGFCDGAFQHMDIPSELVALDSNRVREAMKLIAKAKGEA